ncbi:MAG: dihydroorotase [Bacteroidota bacterium]
MQQLFRVGKLVWPGHERNGQAAAILVADGKVLEVAATLENIEAETFDFSDCSLSPGWINLEASGGDPGLEQREDMASLQAAAAQGGFTHTGLRPGTIPPVQDKASVHYVLQASQSGPVRVLPLGALTHQRQGQEITEMIDMYQAGAVAFTDGDHAIQHAGVMLRALQYAKSFDGLVMNQAQDATIAGEGQLHEGIISTQLGMQGLPALAEELMVERDLRLLAYTDGRLHLSHLSTAGAVAQVRRAKDQGLRVTASVAALNLLLTVEELQQFDSYLKVLPPLRAEQDRQALIAGLQDGTIDCISANHQPLELEAKALEFLYADFGAATLSTAFGAIATALRDHLTEEQIIAKLTTGPAQLLDLPVRKLKAGAVACFTIYNFDENWTPKRRHIRSKSKNAPLLDRALRGRPKAIVHGKHLVLAQ